MDHAMDDEDGPIGHLASFRELSAFKLDFYGLKNKHQARETLQRHDISVADLVADAPGLAKYFWDLPEEQDD
ncbi:hypothetical protein ACIPPM_12040 [Streptomyces sp. NPDC090119]|uniref:hypothetical protein n=1 Tax=Streptomyces sp. NPDC090119 TaxID=3365951 RepID=UPI00381C67B8